jgi:endo-1,4-beta-xylanase
VIAAGDNCGSVGVSNVVIQQVTSDEPENGVGDGNTLNDIVIAPDCKSVQLRAERQNAADGRVYTITFKVTDTSGNVGTNTSTVTVPKNLGVPVVNSGVAYTKTGNCP